MKKIVLLFLLISSAHLIYAAEMANKEKFESFEVSLYINQNENELTGDDFYSRSILNASSMRTLSTCLVDIEKNKKVPLWVTVKRLYSDGALIVCKIYDKKDNSDMEVSLSEQLSFNSNNKHFTFRNPMQEGYYIHIALKGIIKPGPQNS